MEAHIPQYSTSFHPPPAQTRYLDVPEPFDHPTSSCRDDPIHSPALQLLAEACDMPQRFLPPNEIPPPPIASCSYLPGYSKSPLARFAAMPSRPAPKYHSRRPEVVKLLAESAISPEEALPLSSDYPQWVITVAALSLYAHPTYPAHLAFWRPNTMVLTAQFIDRFLKTREARYLETFEDWIDAEFSLYTLSRFQSGFYPHLYGTVTGGRMLRKRKAKEITPDAPHVAQDAKPKRGTKRARKAKRSNSPESIIEPNSPPPLEPTPPPPADVDLENNIIPTNDPSPLKSPSSSPDLLTPPDLVTIHRKRSPSTTPSGASGVTLVDFEGVDTGASRENSPTETVVDLDEVSDTRVSEQRAKDPAEKLDVDVTPVRSSSSPVESTPPPQPRRSTRVRKPVTQIVKRPSVARSRSKKLPA